MWFSFIKFWFWYSAKKYCSVLKSFFKNENGPSGFSSDPLIYVRFLIFFFFLNFGFIYLFMAVLGLRFCARAFSSCGKWGPFFIAVRGPLTIAALLRSTGSRRAGSVIVAHGPSCSAACGILPDQGSNPCPLAGRFSTTAPPGKPCMLDFYFIFYLTVSNCLPRSF